MTRWRTAWLTERTNWTTGWINQGTRRELDGLVVIGRGQLSSRRHYFVVRRFRRPVVVRWHEHGDSNIDHVHIPRGPPAQRILLEINANPINPPVRTHYWLVIFPNEINAVQVTLFNRHTLHRSSHFMPSHSPHSFHKEFQSKLLLSQRAELLLSKRWRLHGTPWNNFAQVVNISSFSLPFPLVLVHKWVLKNHCQSLHYCLLADCWEWDMAVILVPIRFLLSSTIGVGEALSELVLRGNRSVSH